ncbi:protein translocase subunit SecD [Prochlorococcus marinus]|uniref:protein translocase subunit SecD n=1 Tax=Prochlorococcus marinus TaxID=1219 RepID=UPI001ADBE473|nr:protein translocase subunit SecD [Prochlorococcus marinus]MBO8219063.1 protein translocase subunit SecD [Prochlorococcus marinus CUG1416]MBW3051457.1 protein translocase subunit SecD [Prochlorococcus marinus str. MU1416]
MKRRQGWLFFIIFLLTLSIYLLINYPLQLGLDLRGGSQLTLQIIKEEGKVTKDELEAVNSVIDRRVNNLGVSESNLQTLGGDQLILELPGEQNPLVASRVLGKTALLEFRTQKLGTSSNLKELQFQRLNIKNLIEEYSSIGKNQYSDEFLNTMQESLKEIEKKLNYSANNKELYAKLIEIKKYIDKEITNLFIKTDLSGKDLINAGRRQEQTNSNWEVLLTFNNSGGEKFAAITKSIAGTNQLLAIILDGESISEASVGSQFANTGITGGLATISGNFSAENARELEVQLKGGSLPLPIEIVETNTIGALLGSKNILKSLYAAISGLIFVGIFMIFNYRILGFVSVLSLGLYGFFNLALYSLIPVTLTLPGISGLILSIGMAVDANILIFERIREELYDGNTLTRSIDSGFQRANSSIVDGHITTLLSCFVLFLLGTNFVKGFAATLGIGVLISLFTSLNCSKTILRFLTTYQSLRQKNLYVPKNNLSN